MFLASIKVFSSSNSNLSGVLLRDEMFKPFAFTATRQELFLNFVSGIGDSQPWVAVDLGPVRLIQSVSIAQRYETALKGLLMIISQLPFNFIKSLVINSRKLFLAAVPEWGQAV